MSAVRSFKLYPYFIDIYSYNSYPKLDGEFVILIQHDRFVGKDIIRGNLNPDTSGTDDESRNDDAPKEDMTLKESLESASCDDDVEKGYTLKRSYRSMLIGREK